MFQYYEFKNFFTTIINFKINEIRQAWRAGIICVACVIVNEFSVKTEFPSWILITALVCLQANFGATVIRAKQRLVGTVLGCVLAYGLFLLFPGQILMYLVIVLISVVFAIFNSFNTVRSYTYTIFFFTLALMMLYVSIYPNGLYFALLRIEDVAIGVFFGTLGSLLLWPSFAKKSFNYDIFNLTRAKSDLFISILEWMDGKKKSEDVYSQKILSATYNQAARTRISEIYYEKIGKSHFPSKYYEAFILSQERIHYSLLIVYNALKINFFENRTQNFSFVKECLTEIMYYFDLSLKELPLLKSKETNFLEQRQEVLSEIELLENKILKNLYHEKKLRKSFEHNKICSLLERLLQEIKLMNNEINKLREYYQKDIN